MTYLPWPRLDGIGFCWATQADFRNLWAPVSQSAGRVQLNLRRVGVIP